jgi:acyl-CoA dehydrogenase
MNESPTVSQVDDEEFQQILQLVRTFVREEVVPREREISETDAIPDDIRKKAAEMGLFGYAIPQEYGGLGLHLSQDVELAFHFGYTSLSFRSLFGTNNGIAGQVLVGYGTEEQRQEWLPQLASGDVIASFALTEPEAGSNPSGMRTTARREDGGWVINGNKRFITNAPLAGLFVVFAKVQDDDQAKSRIAVFLVPADAPGLHVATKDKKMGQEGASTADLAFENVRVPDSALVSGDIDTGYRAAMTVLARGRVHISALAVGVMERALEASVRFSAVNIQGGVPTGDQQLVQAMLAEQAATTMAAKQMTREAARLYVSGEDRRLAPSAAKLFCTEAAGRVVDLAVQTHGGSGYMREYTVERLFRDARLLRLYEGTSEIQKLIVGRELIRRERAGEPVNGR